MKRGRVLDQTSPSDFWAVNIRARGICLARLQSAFGDTDYALRDFFWQPYVAGTTSAERKIAQATALKEVLERARVVERNIVLSIPGGRVFTRVRTQELKNLGEIKEISQEIIRQQLPFGSINDVSWGYHFLDKNDTEFSFVMAGIMNKDMDQYLELLDVASCRLHGVTSDAFASYNWYKHCGMFDSQLATALVELDDDKAEVVCESRGQFAFNRSLNLRLPPEHKQDPNNPVKLHGAYRKPLGEEINRAFQYFRSTPGGTTTQKILFSGDSIELAEAIAYLHKTLSFFPLEVSVAGCESHNGDDMLPAQMSAVLGLALSCHQDVSVDINLLANTAYESFKSPV